ncbi:MAG TPA: HAD-IA family hydrolase, partial [Gammaproteobacteria bacterium]
MSDITDSIKVIAFDVFGTVVDWHGTVKTEVEQMFPGVDGGAFALAWRAGYQPAMAEVMEKGEWVVLDVLHRRILDRVLAEFGLDDLGEAARHHLNRIWHRLDPWPDSVEGLARLKSKYMVSSLSNGNLGLLAEMAKHAGLPWDIILCAETFN